GLDRRGFCRTDQVWCTVVVRRPVVAHCLCTIGSLALGKRLARKNRCAGFCRRRRGPYQRRRERIGLCHGRGQAARLAHGLHVTALSAVYLAGSRTIVAGVVWL